MPTFRLEQGVTVGLPAAPLRVWAWDARTRAPLDLRADFEDGPPDPHADPHHPGLLLLPGVTRPTLVRARPRAGGVFAPGTRIGVRLAVAAAPGAEPVEAVRDGVEVSGLGSADLLVLRPAGPRGLDCTAVDSGGDDPLDGLAARVRSAAWSALRLDQATEQAARAPADVVVLVDRSGSMRPAVEDGSVGALVEALAGLASVVGGAGSLHVGVAGRPPTWLRDTRPRELSASVADVVARHGYTCGFRPSEIPVPAPAGPRALAVVTDAPPPDLAELDARAGADGTRCHVLLVGTDAADAGPWPARRVARTALPPPPAGAPATDHLLSPGAGPVLDAVVASLLAPWLPTAEPNREPR